MSRSETLRHVHHWAVKAQAEAKVHGEFDVVHAVAVVRQLCLKSGATEVIAAHVATAASELANNLWMHTQHGGQVTVVHRVQGHESLIELSAVDKGPGIVDKEQALQDGFSTCGSMGCGLPGVARLMDAFDLWSEPGQGTRIRSLKWLQGKPACP